MNWALRRWDGDGGGNEAQDLGVGQLRFLAALVGDQADGLFFAGDLGQRGIAHRRQPLDSVSFNAA